LAVFTSKTQSAKAVVVAFNILALPTIKARFRRAFIHLDSAVWTSQARFAEAQSAEIAIDALTVITAW
jgi:hypothetical protein